MQFSFYHNLTVFALFVQFASVLMEIGPMLLPLVLFCTVFGYERQSLGAERETFDEGFVVAFIIETIGIKLLIESLLHVFVLYEVQL